MSDSIVITDMKFENGEVVIRFPFTPGTEKGYPLTSSGKSRLVAKANFAPVAGLPEGCSLSAGINIVSKLKKEELGK